MLRISLRSVAVAAAAASLAVAAPAAGAAATPADHPPPLAIGSAAPDFSLPGIDGKTYTLASFKDAKALVVIFTAVHCPTAEVYEARIKTLVADYRPKGVAFAVIQPNNAQAVRLDEMGYTDLGDSIRGHEDARRAPRLQLPVSLRRRDAGGHDEVWPGRDAARLRLRSSPHAALPGPHRQQPAGGLRQGRGHPARPRRRARRRQGARGEDAHGRLLDQVARQDGVDQCRAGCDSEKSRSR